jgi:hypothetical protein
MFKHLSNDVLQIFQENIENVDPTCNDYASLKYMYNFIPIPEILKFEIPCYSR